MYGLIDKNVLVNELRGAFGKAYIYNDTRPSINDYINITDHTTPLDYPITTTSTSVLSADDISGGSITIPSSTYTVTTIGVTNERTIEEIVQGKIEEYKEIMKLQALGCKNCGGSIDKKTMICEYCGTNYRN